MNKSEKWVVVGGDGLIGSYLGCFFTPSSPNVILTSRRKNADGGRLFADLDGGDIKDVIAANADVVFLCAAMTSMQACDENPERSYRINVTETVNLASQLVKQGAFVVFLSSNTVFNGLIKSPTEDEPYSPVTEYGRQKAEAEKQLLAIPHSDTRIAIVRLSKVLAPHSGMVAKFLRCFRAGESCQAFDDLKISPISLCYVSKALSAIASRKLSGVFHLSGASEVSYAEFACLLATYVAVKQELVKAVSFRSLDTDVLFRVKYPALGMMRTQKALGINPETMNQVLYDILN